MHRFFRFFNPGLFLAGVVGSFVLRQMGFGALATIGILMVAYVLATLALFALGWLEWR